MALPKSNPDRVNNETLLTEDYAVGVFERQWKNLLYLAMFVLAGIWFYSEYKETIAQREGEASAQFSSIATDLNALIEQTLKEDPSKDLVEQEDRIVGNLARLVQSDSSTYSSFATILNLGFKNFKGKDLSTEEEATLNSTLLKYKDSKDSLILYEMIKLIKCRFLLESGKTEIGLNEVKSLLLESKVVFPQVASLLMIFSSEETKKDNQNFISDQLKLKPELEEQTKVALYELGYSLS